ncbi:uncharacterized protein LOC122388162 [Amphibalanus amphitrite]|uniref:uncharacterized protein LOC122388162 n=1 Tax=Amphibalanus amphitrite TaxID=1232801 RepID=UPI001C906840|nr:uncharacterized protein LOC122388162 [Amphibalanus amphitrite]
MRFQASGSTSFPLSRLLTLLMSVLLTGVLLLTLTSTPASAEEEELPEPEALVSYPDLFPAADGGHQSSYSQPSYGYQPPSYGYQPPSYGYQPPSYGYGHKDDCGDLDLLGVLAGGGALAALAVYILVTQAMMMRRRRSLGRELDEFETEVAQVFRGPARARNFADTTVNVTCQVAEWIAGDEPEPLVQARDGGSDCFSGLVGAAAGFAALGALIAYALYLASQAMAARSFSFFDGIEIDEQGLSLVAQMALLFLDQDKEPTCLPHSLCRLNQRAHSISPTHYLATKLASLPAGWFLGSRMAPGGVRSSGDRSFLRMCRGITLTGSESDCDRYYPTCGSDIDR